MLVWAHSGDENLVMCARLGALRGLCPGLSYVRQGSPGLESGPVMYARLGALRGFRTPRGNSEFVETSKIMEKHLAFIEILMMK